MRLYDCEQEAQEELIDSVDNNTKDTVPVFDRGRNDGQTRDFSDFK
jgi:hypothetical protein